MLILKLVVGILNNKFVNVYLSTGSLGRPLANLVNVPMTQRCSVHWEEVIYPRVSYFMYLIYKLSSRYSPKKKKSLRLCFKDSNRYEMKCYSQVSTNDECKIREMNIGHFNDI